MPKKAKAPRPSVFEIVGGYNAPQGNVSQGHTPQGHAQQTNNSQGQQAGFAPPVDMLTGIITALNGNPYIIGAAYLIINLGGRYLTLELTKQQEAFLANKALRPLLLFAVLFIATRNLAVAFWTTIVVLAIIWVFANENHIMCLVPGWRKDGEAQLPLPQGMFVLGQAPAATAPATAPTATAPTAPAPAPTVPETFTAAKSEDNKTYEEKMKIIKDASN